MTSCLISFARSIAVASTAATLGIWFRPLLTHQSGWRRRLAFASLLAPVVAPQLMSGYVYAHLRWVWTGTNPSQELIYAILLILTYTPLATIASALAPAPAVDDAAVHCWRLMGRDYRWRVLRVRATRHLGTWLPVMGLVFLATYQEFELASMLNVTTWTVWLFDAQVGGLPTSDALRLTILPNVLQFAVVIPTWIYARSHWTEHSLSTEASFPARSALRIASARFLVIASLTACLLIPSFSVMRVGVSGIGMLSRNLPWLREIGIGCALATWASCAAYGTMWICGAHHRHPPRWAWTILGLACIPGMLGPLTLALAVQSIFQVPMAAWMYDTPIPWLIAASLFAVPRALLLDGALRRILNAESQWAIDMLTDTGQPHQRSTARRLRWRWQFRPRAFAYCLVAYWVYVDVTLAALLAPVAIVPAPVRLHNLMHYGQSESLSALTFAVYAVPLSLIAAGMLVVGIVAKRPAP